MTYCCEKMDELMMMRYVRDNIIIDENGQAWLWWSDGDTTELNYCPYCGKKFEFRKEIKE